MVKEEKISLTKYYTVFIASWIPEFAVSWLIAKLLDTSIWYVFLGIQAIKIVLWFIRISIQELLFHLLLKRGDVDKVSNALNQHNYPNPMKYTYGTQLIEFKGEPTYPENYFYSVMNDDELDIQTRLDAAQTYTILTESPLKKGYLATHRFKQVFYYGIKRYHDIQFSGRDYADFDGKYIYDSDIHSEDNF